MPYLLSLILAIYVASSPLEAGAPSDYFPSKVFSDDESLNNLVAHGYWGMLESMSEPSLLTAAKDKDATIYRFTCLRTFHNPFCIRVQWSNTGYHLERKVLSGKGGFEPGNLKETARSALNTQKVALLEQLLSDAQFSTMPTVILKEEVQNFDGSEWILEVVKQGNYKIVTRRSPTDNTPIRKIGEWFFSTANWVPDPLY